jgi:hypothetical protein
MSGKGLLEANKLLWKSAGGLSERTAGVVASKKDRSFERWPRKWLKARMTQIIQAGRRFILRLTRSRDNGLYLRSVQ